MIWVSAALFPLNNGDLREERMFSMMLKTDKTDNWRSKMKKNKVRTMPGWIFTLLACGAFCATGIYIGKVSVLGFSSADLIRLLAFAALGLVMLWGSLFSD
jgi:hypothetical protein